MSGGPDSTSPLWERIALQIERRPDAVALHVDGADIRYAQFGAQVEQATASLRADHVGPGHVVAWLGVNTPLMLATLLACARRGAVFLPLNWRLTAVELAAITRHAGVQMMLGTQEMLNLVAQVLPESPPVPPDGSARPGDLLLVYTSGTTGEPKGAMHTQAGMLANLEAAQQVQGLTDADRVLAVLPMFHVGGLCIQTLPALAAGASVNLHARFDPAAWLRDVAGWRPSTSLLVPAVMRSLIEHPHWPSTDLSSLRFVNTGSSIVPVSQLEAFHERGVPASQVYGSTETGPFSIALRPDDAVARAGQVGWPAPGVQARLVDAAGQPLGPGQVGEIQLRAANLMRGYHRQPPGAGFVDGWYATGDLAQTDADGCYTVVGRSKDMIISGGENIYPAEIENLAIGWPGVAEAAVVGLPDARWGEVPVLVLVPQPGATIDLDGLRAHFEGRLARFKHPRDIVVRDEVPRTALGKVQKAALASSLAAAPDA